MISNERIHLEVCLTKLEAARYDRLCTKLMVRKLRANLKIMAQPQKLTAYQTIDEQNAYIDKLSGIISVLEDNIQKTELGKQLLDELNERTCQG